MHRLPWETESESEERNNEEYVAYLAWDLEHGEILAYQEQDLRDEVLYIATYYGCAIDEQCRSSNG